MPAAYPQEFKDDEVTIVCQGELTFAQAARDFRVSETSVSNWVRQACSEDGKRQGVTTKESAELAEARRRIRILEQIRSPSFDMRATHRCRTTCSCFADDCHPLMAAGDKRDVRRVLSGHCNRGYRRIDGRRGPMFRRIRRCYDCGLDYSRRQHSVCPRCGETRILKLRTPYGMAAGAGWQLQAGSGVDAAGEAARNLRRVGNDAIWEMQSRPEGRPGS